MYDYDELRRAWLKFLKDFELDTFAGPGLVLPGKMLDSIDYKLHHWPGHGLADNISLYQYIEGEYMKAKEYRLFHPRAGRFYVEDLFPSLCGGFFRFPKLRYPYSFCRHTGFLYYSVWRS